MPIFAGNTSSTATKTTYNIPSGILTFSVVNKAGASNAINIYLSGTGITGNISIVNLTLADGDTLYSGNGINVLPNTTLTITATGSTDYYFNINNL